MYQIVPLYVFGTKIYHRSAPCSRPSSPESKKKESVEDALVLAEVDVVVRGVRLASVVLLRPSAWLRTGTLAAIGRRSSSLAEEFEDGGARTRGRVARRGGGLRPGRGRIMARLVGGGMASGGLAGGRGGREQVEIPHAPHPMAPPQIRPVSMPLPP
jgi:hypothetical protein